MRYRKIPKAKPIFEATVVYIEQYIPVDENRNENENCYTTLWEKIVKITNWLF